MAGSGPSVVMIPSLGRGGSDFEFLAASLRGHGYSTLPLTARVASMISEQSFEDLADAIVQFCSHCGTPPMHLVGHAYGQALSRCIVTRHPRTFAGLVLLACGGSMPEESVQRSLEAATDAELARTNPAEHLRHVAHAFFAPGNDASVWSGGWYQDVAEVEMETMMRTPIEYWRSGALDRTLIVQGLQDAVAPPEHGRSFCADVPSARLVEVECAGHALLPEHADVVAATVIAFLNESTGKQVSDGTMK